MSCPAITPVRFSYGARPIQVVPPSKGHPGSKWYRADVVSAVDQTKDANGLSGSSTSQLCLTLHGS